MSQHEQRLSSNTRNAIYALQQIAPRVIRNERLMPSWIPNDLSQFESAAIALLLDRPGELYSELRHQLSFASVAERELTGVGSYRSFIIPSDAPIRRDLPDATVSDIHADHPSLEAGACAILFVRDGIASFLECVTCDGEWPSDESAFTLHLTIS